MVRFGAVMKGYFEGWFYKHQNKSETVSLIPGIADDTAFIQVITHEKPYFFPFPISEFTKKGEDVIIGRNFFSDKGIDVDIDYEGDRIKGCIKYEDLTPIHGDIMGFFRFLPLQCRHGVISLHHSLRGSLEINGRHLDINNGTGYIEKDSGRSFPKNYAWIQSNDFPEKCCVMAAIAHIPFLVTDFQGIICVVWYKGREYRLATYNGAKVIHYSKDRITIKRGKFLLDIDIFENKGHMLLAPKTGKMTDNIKEAPSCRAIFKFYENDDLIFQMDSEKSSFEFV